MRKAILRTMVMAVLAAAFAPAGAQSPQKHVLEKPTKEQLIGRFLSVTKNFRPLKTQDIVECGAEGGGTSKTLQVSAGELVNLDVQFKYDSDELTPEAKGVLDEVGSALADSSLSSTRFVVTGHTDMSGTEAYNAKLSCARAVAVRNYLVDQHRITRSRLVLRGLGYKDLLDADNPTSAVNRRVELRKIGG